MTKINLIITALTPILTIPSKYKLLSKSFIDIYKSSYLLFLPYSLIFLKVFKTIVIIFINLFLLSYF